MIWVIAGTRDARELIDIILLAGHHISATTTTGYGKGLIGERPNLDILAGPMDRAGMEAFVRERGISVIVDASHPYAAEVSRNAIEVSRGRAIPYIRLERPPVDIVGAVVVDTYDQAARRLEAAAGNIMLTIGTKNLSHFTRITGVTVYARVLPTIESIAECARHGFRPDQIVAARFPFTKEFNMALFRDLGIRHLVSKESGNSGGAPEKFAAAAELGIETILIRRPDVAYPELLFDPMRVARRIEEICPGPLNPPEGDLKTS